MKFVLIITFIVYASSSVDDYLSSCKSGAYFPRAGFESIDRADCRKYNPSNGYCCRLSYEKTVYELNSYANKTYNECFGISKSGYMNIGQLVDSLSNSLQKDHLRIDCFSFNLKFKYLLLIFLLFIYYLN